MFDKLYKPPDWVDKGLQNAGMSMHQANLGQCSYVDKCGAFAIGVWEEQPNIQRMSILHAGDVRFNGMVESAAQLDAILKAVAANRLLGEFNGKEDV